MNDSTLDSTLSLDELAEAAKGSEDLERFVGALRNAGVVDAEARLVPGSAGLVTVSIRGSHDDLALHVAAFVNVLQIGDGYEVWTQLEAGLESAPSASASLGTQFDFLVRRPQGADPGLTLEVSHRF